MTTTTVLRRMALAGLLLALCGVSPADAGFRSPESLVRNVYAYYGNRTSPLSSGLPDDAETAQQFFDASVPIPKFVSFLRSHVSNFGSERTLANLLI
jgi:hypothetical protein